VVQAGYYRCTIQPNSVRASKRSYTKETKTMVIQTTSSGLDPSMDYDMIDSVKQGREHPKIKGLAVRRQDLSETLTGAGGTVANSTYPWLRTKENVAYLTRLVSLMFGLARLQAGWIPNCPSYDLKTQIPARLYEDVRHVMRLRERLAQLPGGRDRIDPDPALQSFLDALGRAGDHHQFLAGLYLEVKRSLLRHSKISRGRATRYTTHRQSTSCAASSRSCANRSIGRTHAPGEPARSGHGA
jgi:hypothetical protein